MQIHPWLAVANSHREINQMMVVTQQKSRPTVDCKGTIIWSLVQCACVVENETKQHSDTGVKSYTAAPSLEYFVSCTSPVLLWPVMYLKTMRDLRKQNQSNKLILIVMLPHIPKSKSKTAGKFSRKSVVFRTDRNEKKKSIRLLLNGVN